MIVPYPPPYVVYFRTVWHKSTKPYGPPTYSRLNLPYTDN